MYYNPESRALDLTEMTVNAKYICSYLTSKGWTKNAIAGVLGNMQSESTINPARWQGDNIGNTNAGYGLVQWTPATKYLDWCTARNLDRLSMDSALTRILEEVATDTQWGANAVQGSPPYDFEGFTHSTESAYALAVHFLWYYERPASQNSVPQDVSVQEERGNQATYWFNTLTGGNAGGVGYTAPHSMKIFEYIGKRRIVIK